MIKSLPKDGSGIIISSTLLPLFLIITSTLYKYVTSIIATLKKLDDEFLRSSYLLSI